jgi:hypothetical protein
MIQLVELFDISFDSLYILQRPWLVFPFPYDLGLYRNESGP